MNTYYTLLSLAFILLISSSSLAHRIHPYEQYHESFPGSESKLIIPTDSEISWYQYPSLPSHHISDGKIYFSFILYHEEFQSRNI